MGKVLVPPRRLTLCIIYNIVAVHYLWVSLYIGMLRTPHTLIPWFLLAKLKYTGFSGTRCVQRPVLFLLSNFLGTFPLNI